MREKVMLKFKNDPYMSEKFRFLLFALALFMIFFLARFLLGMAYARYEVRTKINANIDKALYIFESGSLSFNLEPQGIIPSNSPYVYSFTVSNFNADHDSDVDMTYQVSIRTTTNLPITIQMYRNQNYNAQGATNILSSPITERDTDGTWYRVYNVSGEFPFNYANHTTDTYTMVINFPASYSQNMTYANSIESIEVHLDSRQVI